MRAPREAKTPAGGRRARGFTLVELLVALFAMALLAVLSWRGLDGMVRAQEQTRTRADEVQALQVGLAQWTADLDALVQQPQMNALDWNGRVLRLTRTAPVDPAAGLVVVAWAQRAGPQGTRWMRWQSPPATSRGQLDEAWRRAEAWGQAQGGAGGTEVAITPLLEWRIFYYRADAWTNPLSSDAAVAAAAAVPGGAAPPGTAPGVPGAPAQAASAPAAPAAPGLIGNRVGTLPDGVRLVLSLPPGQAIGGELVRDWVRPTVAGGRS